ncbi:hypothetical protein SAMN05216214_104163 [Atopomonas hussainii]|uniref:UPF0250 protein SAMN05216214_104163 n=1 Tax=Atopomonas hussainii TaxID=1429083 RepID=A0A1H7J435_9GAMM|nr:DUF493 domain-containing protein [Atopomonas hussainii]SEK69428.1 hypothetical protein SAMN05216214_104163 [Atopomonas hussainii]
MSEDVQAPKIEFPCADYPVKIIGDAAEDFSSVVIEIIQRHDPAFDETCVNLRASSNGRFVSVQVRMLATSEAQLKQLHEDLRATGRVHMVL